MTPTTAQRNAVYHALTAMAGQLPFAVRDELAGLLAAPVAPAVTLTDEEREALLSGADALYGIGHDAEAATLRSLLARAAKEATP